jgi:hypothetical protein
MNYTVFLSDTAVIIKAAGMRRLGHVIRWTTHLHLNDSCSLNPRLQTSRATNTTMVWLCDRYLANIYVRKWRREPNTEKNGGDYWYSQDPLGAVELLLLMMIARQFN